eukprot:2045980-Ditylum_brightwellii.AAC.1
MELNVGGKYDTSLPKNVRTSYPKDYRPELDSSPELGATDVSYYHSCIGVLRWIMELGQVDIITELLLLSSHLALPRKGHLETKEFYGDAKVPIPHNAQETRGKEVDLRLFIDSDHVGDKINRRSRTGIFVYLNIAPVL